MLLSGLAKSPTLEDSIKSYYCKPCACGAALDFSLIWSPYKKGEVELRAVL